MKDTCRVRRHYDKSALLACVYTGGGNAGQIPAGIVNGRVEELRIYSIRINAITYVSSMKSQAE